MDFEIRANNLYIILLQFHFLVNMCQKHMKLINSRDDSKLNDATHIRSRESIHFHNIVIF